MADAQDLTADRVAEERWPYGEQDEHGNSLANIRSNLRLSPVERLRQAEGMARFFNKYQGVIHRKQV